MDGRNVSEILAGDCIQTSPYRLTMKVDMYCKQLCVADLSHGEMKAESPNEMGRAIRKKYHNNWIVDNIPAASTVEDDSQVITRYSQGFLMGFIAGDTKKAYVHNHVNIEIQYHAVETDPTKGRIVRFSVEPFSIKHELEASANDDDGPPVGEDGAAVTMTAFKVADILNPIESCNPKSGIRNIPSMAWCMLGEGSLKRLLDVCCSHMM
jgi:hypothetical protein